MQVIHLTGKDGKMYSIAVISLSTYTANRDKLLYIYEMFKDFIPPKLRNREEFQINGNQIQIPIDRDSDVFSKIIDAMYISSPNSE